MTRRHKTLWKSHTIPKQTYEFPLHTWIFDLIEIDSNICETWHKIIHIRTHRLYLNSWFGKFIFSLKFITDIEWVCVCFKDHVSFIISLSLTCLWYRTLNNHDGNSYYSRSSQIKEKSFVHSFVTDKLLLSCFSFPCIL